MNDENGEDITGPADVAADPPVAPKAAALTAGESASPAARGDKLSSLMAGKAPSATGTAVPDLEAQALRAAEQALIEGEQALAAARAHLHEEQARASAKPASGRNWELALRLLLSVNVLAMVIIAMLPAPVTDTATGGGVAETVATEPPSEPATSRFNEPWNRAMDAADRRDFGEAVRLLEGYLADSPRMAPSQKLSVLMALSHYAARNNDFKKSQDYQRRAEAIDRSHSLPDDLVAMAQAAAKSGDQETLRRVWARFLLQQRQIPSWLYQHVAEAYLQLGDSYRQDADAGAERARLKELEAAAALLRQEGAAREDKR